MRSKLVQLGRRLEEIDAMLSAPDAANDMNRFRDLSRERSELEPVVAKMKQYETAEADIEVAQEMLDDPEMKDFAAEEIAQGKELLEALEKERNLRRPQPITPANHKKITLKNPVLNHSVVSQSRLKTMIRTKNM